MAVSAVARALLLTLIGLFAVEAFVVPARAPRTTLPRTLFRQGQQLTPASNTATRSLAPARMSQYEQSSEPSARGDLGGTPEMELQELIVEFTDDGRILLEVKGVKGSECRAITEELIQELGDVITTENTEEYFEERVVNVQRVPPHVRLPCCEQDAVQLGWSYDATKPEW